MMYVQPACLSICIAYCLNVDNMDTLSTHLAGRACNVSIVTAI